MNLISYKQQRILGRSSTVPQKPALPLSLSTLRLKLLEDSSLDTAPDVDPGKDSSAVDGKREGFHSCPLQMCAPVRQAHPLCPPACPLVSSSPVGQYPGEFGNSFCMGGGGNLQLHGVGSGDNHQEPAEPVAFSFLPGPCAEVLAQQREATTRLLQVLEDLEQAHEEFQKRG